MNKERGVKFSPNGAYIPGWPEVRVRFLIDIGGDYSEREMKLFESFCQAQIILAGDSPEGGRIILRALDQQVDFPQFEERHGPRLTEICKFIRRSERLRT